MMIYKLIPKYIRNYVKIARRNITFKTLDFVGTHLTDHCNLKCKGCGHFSPIADEWFASPDEHARDMKRLSELFSKIRLIRLMGGEPLLHPDVKSFIISTRQFHPKSEIQLVTNGILLLKMKDDFWKICRENNIIVYITVYPPLRNNAEKLKEICRLKGVKSTFCYANWFRMSRNFSGNSNPKKAFRLCRARYCCPFLKQGSLYTCALPTFAFIPNKHFGTQIPATCAADIYEDGIDSRQILKKIYNPIDACAYCREELNMYKWELSKGSVEEWDDNFKRE